MLLRRASGLLCAALILFGSSKGIAGTACAVHGTVQTDKTDEHAAHANHGAPAQSSHENHDSCTCLDHCPSCLTAGLVAVAPQLPQLSFRTFVPRAVTAPESLARSRAPHQLPFANAPPIV